MSGQEVLTFLLVGLAAGSLGWGFFQKHLRLPLAAWLLRRGQVKWAMRLRFKAADSRGKSCHD